MCLIQEFWGRPEAHSQVRLMLQVWEPHSEQQCSWPVFPIVAAYQNLHPGVCVTPPRMLMQLVWALVF